MKIFDEVKLAKELIKFPSITPADAGVMKFLEKKLKKIGFKTNIIEFKEKNFKPVKNLYAKIGKKGPNFSKRIDLTELLALMKRVNMILNLKLEKI